MGAGLQTCTSESPLLSKKGGPDTTIQKNNHSLFQSRNVSDISVAFLKLKKGYVDSRNNCISEIKIGYFFDSGVRTSLFDFSHTSLSYPWWSSAVWDKAEA